MNNSNITIEDIKIITDDSKIASLKCSNNEESFYFTCFESDEIPVIIQTKDDILDILSDQDQLEENIEWIDEHILSSFYDIELDELDYSEIYENIENSENKNAAKLIKLLLDLVTLDSEKADALINKVLH